MNVRSTSLLLVAAVACQLLFSCNNDKKGKNIAKENVTEQQKDTAVNNITTSAKDSNATTKSNAKKQDSIKINHPAAPVIPALAYVSPTKMNVLYVGVENPVEVTVPGIPSDKLRMSSINVSFRKIGDVFVVRPKSHTAGRKAIITVSARINDKITRIGSYSFRIKRLPDPYAIVANKRDGKIRKNTLLAQRGVFAEMSEDFDFDARFVVTRFTVSSISHGYFMDARSNSYKFTGEQHELIKRLGVGDKVFIHDIKAVGPDGIPRTLSPIILTIG